MEMGQSLCHRQGVKSKAMEDARDANDARSGIGIPVRSRGFSQLIDKLRQRRKQAQSDAKPDYAEVEREIAQETAAVEQAAH